MKKDPEDYLKEPYSRILIPNDDGTFSAEILEFPGCFAQGNTSDEAFCNLEKAAQSWILASVAQGLEIPEPAMNQGYSGKVALRLPKSLHRQAARMAERDGTSLNQFLVTAIAARLGAEDFYTQLADRFEHRMATTAANVIIYAPHIYFSKSALGLEWPRLESLQVIGLSSSASTASGQEVISNA
jgi:predicted RNase H-like HicB family nuclease